MRRGGRRKLRRREGGGKLPDYKRADLQAALTREKCRTQKQESPAPGMAAGDSYAHTLFWLVIPKRRKRSRAWRGENGALRVDWLEPTRKLNKRVSPKANERLSLRQL